MSDTALSHDLRHDLRHAPTPSGAKATRQRAAIVVLSDPESGSREEALGRVFNALAAAYDYQQRGDDVLIQFSGAATRWIGELAKPDHPAHALYTAVQDTIRGISCACADLFGGADAARISGLDLITDNPVPGTSGLASLPALTADGYSVITF